MSPDQLPAYVQSAGDSGVYWVSSRSRPGLTHRVDVVNYVCDCESARMGNAYRATQEKGYLCSDDFCPHLKRAIIYDGMVLRMMLENSVTNKQ